MTHQTQDTVRRTPGGAVDVDYYYQRGKQMHDRELDRIMGHIAERAKSALRKLFYAGQIGTALKPEEGWPEFSLPRPSVTEPLCVP